MCVMCVYTDYSNIYVRVLIETAFMSTICRNIYMQTVIVFNTV